MARGCDLDAPWMRPDLGRMREGCLFLRQGIAPCAQILGFILEEWGLKLDLRLRNTVAFCSMAAINKRDEVVERRSNISFNISFNFSLDSRSHDYHLACHFHFPLCHLFLHYYFFTLPFPTSTLSLHYATLPTITLALHLRHL